MSQFPSQPSTNLINMNFSHFFIRRPIFAGVLSLIIFILGLLALWRMPPLQNPRGGTPRIVLPRPYPRADTQNLSRTDPGALAQNLPPAGDTPYMVCPA